MFLAILPFGFLKAQNNPDSLIKKQHVKEVVIRQGDRLAGDFQYDINGNLLYFRYDDFAASTSLKVSALNIYNKDQTLLQSKSTHSSYPNDTTVWNYEYDTNKNLLAIIDSKGHTVFNYRYDSLGRKVKELMLEASGQILSETISRYDKNGNKTDEIIKMTSLPEKVNKIYYDSLGRECKDELIENGKMRFRTNYLYFLNTRQLIKETYDEDGDGTRLDGVIFKYDDRKRVIAKLHFNLENGRQIITGEEAFEYFENDLIKKYSENIFTNHVKRSFDYSYNFD